MVKVPSRDPVAALQASRHPFQILLLGASAISGAGSLFGFGPPPSLLFYIPALMVQLWGLINMIAGLLGVLGAFWPDKILGLLMERLALGALAIPSALYGILVYAKNGSAAWTVATFSVGFGIACVVRVIRVSIELGRQRDWLDEHIHWDPDGKRRRRD